MTPDELVEHETPLDRLLQKELRAVIRAALAQLSPLEQEVVWRRYGLLDGSIHTRERIARNLGSTMFKVTRVEFNAARAIRKSRCKGYYYNFPDCLDFFIDVLERKEFSEDVPEVT